jgi:TetR/AcrR family transcriptional repressor of lmrAB and yxaGH operons
MPNAAIHRDKVIETAMRLFRRQGYASTGLQQILAESGAPKGSLYHYFPGGKEELGAAAVSLAGDLIREMLTDLAHRHAEPQAFVRGYCRVMANWMAESDFRSGCPIATTLLENAPQSPTITQAGLVAIDSWIDVAAGVFGRVEKPARAARVRAQLLVGSIEGALLLARLRQSKQPILDVARLF